MWRVPSQKPTTELTLLPSCFEKVILRGLVSWLIASVADLEYELNEICHAYLATFFLINNPLIINTLDTYVDGYSFNRQYLNRHNSSLFHNLNSKEGYILETVLNRRRFLWKSPTHKSVDHFQIQLLSYSKQAVVFELSKSKSNRAWNVWNSNCCEKWLKQ